MENWDLRRYQSARIAGTADHGRLRDAVTAARAHVAGQPTDRAGTWVSLGPSNVPGRIGALAISQQDSRILYAGSAAGGVFKSTDKSTDGGTQWTPLWSDQESLAIGGLSVA